MAQTDFAPMAQTHSHQTHRLRQFRETVMSENYPWESDCVWTASDRVDNLAAFVTAGAGPIPKHLIDEGLALLLDCERKLLELPKISKVFVCDVPGHLTSFLELAERGFFVYDWLDVHRVVDKSGAYELVAYPQNALLLPALSSDIVSTRFAGVEFSQNVRIDVSSFAECVSKPL
jgi:hypothetical protein